MYRTIHFIISNESHHILIIFFLIHVINVILDGVVAKMKNKRKEETSLKEDLKATISACLILFLLFIITSIIFKIKILQVIIAIMHTVYLIYILVICPLLNIKLTYTFKDDSTIVSSFLYTGIIMLDIGINHSLLTNLSNNKILFQSMIIIFILIKLLLLFYFILLNIYNIFRNFNILVLNNMRKKIKRVIKKIDKKYNLDYIYTPLNKKKHYYIIKIPIFLFKLMLWVLAVLMARSLVYIIYFFLEKVCNLFKSEKNDIYYIISKISLIIALFVTYCITVFTNGFSKSIISIFELMVSTIIIPIVLEMLISRKNNNHNELRTK